MVNVVVWSDLAERYRPALMQSQLLQVKDKLEDLAGVRHLIAGHLQDRSDLLKGLEVRSRNFSVDLNSRSPESQVPSSYCETNSKTS